MDAFFTPTTAKLIKHYDRMPSWAERKYYPVSLQLIPTDRCNLNCVFCSVKKRKGDEIDLIDILDKVDKLCYLGLETVEITGGGEPTLYPDIDKLIYELHSRGLLLGLVTNGIRLKQLKHVDKFSWIRISMNTLDYRLDIDLPDIPGTLGFSYVVNEYTTKDKLQTILKKMDEYKAQYLRVLPNCLSLQTMKENTRKFLDFNLYHDRLSWQPKKIMKPPKHCYIGYLKPFLNADGYFYQCAYLPLFYRRCCESFRIGNNVDIIWKYPFEPFSTASCRRCYIEDYHIFFETLANKIPHSEFL
jgi:MoaA/NifB/PqqE/SkfB family radical SAM enzyme